MRARALAFSVLFKRFPATFAYLFLVYFPILLMQFAFCHSRKPAEARDACFPVIVIHLES